MTVQQACDAALQELKQKVDGYGGLIAIDKDGQFAVSFTTTSMSWAVRTQTELKYGLYSGDNFTEKITCPDQNRSRTAVATENTGHT